MHHFGLNVLWKFTSADLKYTQHLSMDAGGHHTYAAVFTACFKVWSKYIRVHTHVHTYIHIHKHSGNTCMCSSSLHRLQAVESTYIPAHTQMHMLTILRVCSSSPHLFPDLAECKDIGESLCSLLSCPCHQDPRSSTCKYCAF